MQRYVSMWRVCHEGFQAGGLLLMLALGNAASQPTVYAETFRIGPDDNWFALLSGDGLRPGDEVVLGEGNYSDSRRLQLSHRGTAERPIVIRAAEDAAVVFHRPDARQNSFNLVGTQHLQLKDFAITGGAAAIRIYASQAHRAEYVTLEGLHIHHVGGVAVTCNHTNNVYRGMVFRRNHIHHTSGHGEGFYLGGNNAAAIFCDSQITDNYIHDLAGPKVSQGDGVEIKQGSYGNLIARNVIHSTNYPAITVYGTAGRAPNRLQDNVIWRTADSGIQAAADAAINGNWVANESHCLYSRNHQEAVVGKLDVRDNVFVALGTTAPIRIIHPRDSSGADRFSGPVRLQGNVIVAGQSSIAALLPASDAIQFANNIGTGRVNGINTSLLSIDKASEKQRCLPELSGHPAWEHLSRKEMAESFATLEPRCL